MDNLKRGENSASKLFDLLDEKEKAGVKEQQMTNRQRRRTEAVYREMIVTSGIVTTAV